MKENKMFRVYPRTADDTPKAKILEDLINSPRFREALLREFEAKAKEIAESLMNDVVYPWRSTNKEKGEL